MKIKLSEGLAARSTDIELIEKKIGIRFNHDYLEFIRNNDGAKPESNIFSVLDKNESGINRFIPVNEIINQMPLIETLPPRAFPVAWAEGGNYVVVDQDSNGAVYFWDHEQPDSMVKLADSFFSFLDALEPFDISEITLRPGQVKKVWIDPDFLKDING